MANTNNTPRKTTQREMWIQQRAAELIAAGWHSQALAMKRAAKEWRAHSPQRAAANRRNAAMRQARSERLNALPATDASAWQ
jgi:hypothetical protein